MTTEQLGDRQPSLGTLCVNRLLDRNGIPERKRAAALEKALGLSYQQVRRRLIDESAWTLEELRDLADHFGETLQSLVSDSVSANTASAVLVTGSLRIPCSVWLGNTPQLARPGPLVATRPTAGEWLVLPAGEAAGVESYEIKRLLIQATTRSARRIAVLDDDRDLAQSIAQYMNEVGLDATAFYTVDDLSKAVSAEPFDGYVVDWLVNKQSAKTVIAEIRAQSASCPIVVLTGQMLQGNVDESELSSAAAAYRLQYFEKPARTSAIMSALELGFDRRAKA
jgi:ActR/RegA family two-component response regulator